MLSNDLPTQLNTPLTEPLFLLEKHFLDNCQKIENWFAEKWREALSLERAKFEIEFPVAITSRLAMVLPFLFLSARLVITVVM